MQCHKSYELIVDQKIGFKKPMIHPSNNQRFWLQVCVNGSLCTLRKKLTMMAEGSTVKSKDEVIFTQMEQLRYNYAA